MTSQLPEKESLPSPPLPLLLEEIPPSHRSKSNADDEDRLSATPISAPSKMRSPISPSPSSVPLRQLLLLNQSPIRRPRSRRLQMDVESIDPEYQPPRRRGRNSQPLPPNIVAPPLCSSPRISRRPRRRLEKKEDGEEVKVRRTAMKKHRSKSNRNERLVAVVVEEALPPSPSSQQGACTGNVSLGTWKFVSDLVMWRDVPKSSFWFGFGSLFFLQSFFSKDIKFSMVSAISHLCLFTLAMSFFRHSINQPRSEEEQRRQRFVLKEENLIQITKTLLPILNASIAMTQDVFSGDPSMTLKVAPVLAFTAHYGHFITPWRLTATGFFISFTVPKLYSCYSHQIQTLAFSRISYACEVWKASQHKKIAAFSAGILFWNVFGAKTRILALFISVVIVQYHRKKRMMMTDVDEPEHI